MITLVTAAELATFAAERPPAQDAGIDDLRPVVEAWLSDFNNEDKRTAVIDAASTLWMSSALEQSEGDHMDELMVFRESIAESLAQTTEPDSPPDPAQVERIAVWLSVSAINSGFSAGYAAAGGVRVQWVTMGDSAVRDTHRAVDGQARVLGDTFDVGGFELHYPGDPVGPPAIWINCRCILAPAGRRTERAASMTAAIEEVEDPEEVIPDDVDIEDEDLIDDMPDEIPVHGVATIEGTPTGDGRMFKAGALSNRPLPLPLRYEFVGTHGGDTSNVAVVGRIDEMWLEGNEYRYRGVIMAGKKYAMDAIEGIVDGSLTGVSVEVDNIVLDPEHEAAKQAEIEAALADDGEITDIQNMNVFSEARICGFTIVPIPAYMEAFIGLGPDFHEELTEEDAAALAACGCGEEAIEGEEHVDELEADTAPLTAEEIADLLVAGATFAPGTKDGPGWITHPRATARLRRYWVRGKGAAKIKWGAPGDFNRCRRQLAKYVQNPDWLAGLCANMHKEAIGVWPGMEAGGRHSLLASGAKPVDLFTMTAAGSPAVAPAAWFENPKLTGPTPLHVDLDTGQVYGHLATWGVCHIGIPGVCTTAPHSLSNYAHFRTGVVRTEEGTDVTVGHITLATGHAPIKASAQAAAAHYDNTGSVVADIAAGEDSFGIWVAGSLRAGVDVDQASILRAAALSGDWRTIGGSLELVGALAVNVPGFPVPRTALAASADRQESLVAAGIVVEDGELVAAGITTEDVVAITRNAIREYRHQEKREARLEAVRPVREQVRAERIAAVRAAVEED